MSAARRYIVEVALGCAEGHEWVTKVLGVDDHGAVYQDLFCPKCSRSGRRLPITAEDIQGLFSAAEIEQIGQERLGTLLFLAQKMFDPEHISPESQKRPALTYNEIAFGTAQPVRDVEQQIAELEAMNWIKREPAPADLVTKRERWAYLFAHSWEQFLKPKAEAAAKADGAALAQVHDAP